MIDIRVLFFSWLIMITIIWRYMNWLLSSWSSFNNEWNSTETTNVFCWDVAQVTAVLKQKSCIINLLCLLVNSIITNLEIQIDDKKKAFDKAPDPGVCTFDRCVKCPNIRSKEILTRSGSNRYKSETVFVANYLVDGQLKVHGTRHSELPVISTMRQGLLIKFHGLYLLKNKIWPST